MGNRARVRVLLGAAGAVALLATACTPPPPLPETDYQMHARDAFNSFVPCAATPGPGFTSFDPIVWGIETVDDRRDDVGLFAQGGGFDIEGVTGQVQANTYTVVVLLRMSQLGGFDRILDFKSGTSDSGLYFYNGALRFYPSSATGSKVVASNEWAQVVLTRAADGTVRGFVDGAQQWQFTDTNAFGVISTSNRLIFFRDNISGGGTGEHSAGAVARVRLFDRPLTQTEINNLGQTPASACAV